MIKKILNYILIFICFFTLLTYDVNAATNVSYSIDTYYVRTMAENSPTQVGNYNYKTNPFSTYNITEARWLPRQIGFDGQISGSFNTNYLYTITYRFNYPSSIDIFDWQKYMNYARFMIYGSTNDLFSCSIIANTSSYTDVKCTFKRSTTGNYFFFYFDFYNNYNALRQIGIPSGFGPDLSFSNISLTYTQDTGDIQVEQNNIIINQNNQTNQKLDDVNNSLTDESAPDAPDFSDLEIADDTPISDLVLMPINYLNKLVDAFSNSCRTYSIDFGILGSDYVLNFPCIRVEDWIGSSAWNIIDYLICFFMIYEIGMLAVKIFNDFTSLRDTYDSLYTPKHAKPLGKHTSEVE